MIQLRYPGYFADEEGQIWSAKTPLGRIDMSRLHRLSPIVNRHNRLTVGLGHGKGPVKTHLIHTLVCEAYHGPRPSGKECSHLDGNQLNNKPSNLIWETRRENNLRKRLHGSAQTGPLNGNSKLTITQAEAIIDMVAGGQSIKKTAKLFKVSWYTTSIIAKGISYQGL